MNPTKPIPYRKLESEDVQDIEYLWLQKFNKQAVPKGGNTEIWYRSVVDYQYHVGDEIMPKELREAEDALFNRGLASEYFSALLAIVNPPEHVEEHDKVFCLITASPVEREMAVKKVLKR